MFATDNTIGEMSERQRRRTEALLYNAVAAMGLLVLGFPLTPAAIRATLLGWALAVLAVARLTFRRLQNAGSCAQELCLKETRLDD